MALAGLILALVVWFAGAYAALRAQQAIIRELPHEWRWHPEAGPGYTALLDAGPASVLATAARVAPSLAVVAVLGVVLRAVGGDEVLAVGAVVVGGVLCAQRVLAASRGGVRAFAAREGLAEPQTRGWPYAVALYVACIAAGLTAACAGLALWDLLR
jgi:hypothetical protein